MNANKSHHPKRTLRPIVFALALAMPGAAVVAASMGDVVKTRADQSVDQQYGRDSVYASSPESKPLSPDRTSASQTQGTGSGEAIALQAAPSTAPEDVGSGYVDSEAIANVGSGYVGLESSDQEPDQLVVMLPYDDDTAHQYDRGYYQDPDEVAVFLIAPDMTTLQSDESGSVSGSNMAVAD